MNTSSFHVSVFCFADFPDRKGRIKDFVVGLTDITIDEKNKKVKPPGGMVEIGEYLLHAVSREFAEETDELCTIPDPSLLKEVFREKIPEDHHTKISYIVAGEDAKTSLAPGKTVIVKEKKDTFKLRFWRIDDFWIHLVPAYRERFFFALKEMMELDPVFRKRNQSIFDRVSAQKARIKKEGYQARTQKI